MEIEIRKQMVMVLRALYFSLEERWASLTKSYPISPAQQSVLFILSNDEPLSITQISKIGCWHISTVTRLIKPLIREQYVKVYRDKFNQRTKLAELTSSGRQLITNILTTLAAADDFPFDFTRASGNEICRFLGFGLELLNDRLGKEFTGWIQKAEVIVDQNRLQNVKMNSQVKDSWV